MPNGSTHDKITYITTPVVGIVSCLLVKDITSIVILTLTYLFASMMFNGDLDTNSKPYNRWWLFKMIWIPYQLLFTHRSIWTHWYLLGTVIRLLYISHIIILIFITFKFSIVDINWYYMGLVFIGLELGNSIHTISDAISGGGFK